METKWKPLETGEGNTKPPLETPNQHSNRRVVPSKKWCFTLNNYSPEELVELETTFLRRGFSYVIGLEVGEQGTPHLQGYIRSESKLRPVEAIGMKRIHWEKVRGTEEQNISYCTKEGNFKTNIKIPRPLDILKEEELYPWQREIIDLIKQVPDKRTIHWYWCKQGNTGKTTFCKYLASKYNAVPLDGKKNDVLYCAAEYESDLYVWDLERSMEEFVSYGAIEKIKNGLYTCTKYESKPIIRNCPHILIFANFKPEETKLSRDRWHIVRLDEPNEPDEYFSD